MNPTLGNQEAVRNLRCAALVAATRRCCRCLRCVRLRSVAAPAKVRPHSDRLWLLAPLGKPAVRRVARTLGALRGLFGLGRALLAVVPAAVFSYVFYRDNEQGIDDLHPNFTDRRREGLRSDYLGWPDPCRMWVPPQETPGGSADGRRGVTPEQLAITYDGRPKSVLIDRIPA